MSCGGVSSAYKVQRSSSRGKLSELYILILMIEASFGLVVLVQPHIYVAVSKDY